MKKYILITVILLITYSASWGQKTINLNSSQAPVYSELITPYGKNSSLNEAARLREISLNKDLQSTKNINKGDVIALELFFDKEYSAVIESIEKDINGTLTVIAKLSDFQYAYCFISTYKGNSFMTIEIPELQELYATKYFHDEDRYFLMLVDPSQKQTIEGAPSLSPPEFTPKQGGHNKGNILDNNDLKDGSNINENHSNIPIILKNEHTPDVVTLLIVYTPEAAAWSAANETDINNTISLLMAKANLALDNSNTLLNLQLVHSELVNYTELHSNEDLFNLTFDNDGFMDNVHDLRDTYCADLVVLLEKTNFTGGVGWLLNSAAGRPDYGFSLTRVQQASWTYTTVHEIAHNMGCHHHKNQNVQPGPGLYSYSAGWRWTGASNEKYCSVMTYESGTYFQDGISHVRVPFFSNPDVQYQSVSTGDAVDADNARTIRQIKSVIAAYRNGCGGSDITWTGQINNSWDNPGNWDLNITPLSAYHVTIPSSPTGGNIFPIVSNTAYCNNINIEANASITVNTGATLNVYGNWVNDGQPSTGNGTIFFNGLYQSINGTNEFNHLSVGNTTTVEILSQGQTIKGVLLNNGSITTNGFLTLASNANGTALIDGQSTGVFNGKITQQRFFPANKARGYKHFSSPFPDANLGQLGNYMNLQLGSPGSTPYPTVFTYNEAGAVNVFAQGWQQAAPQGQTNNLFETGIGYTVQLGTGSAGSLTAFLTGTPNHGDYSIGLTRSNPGPGKGDGWNLVGNPYPSPIDLDKLPFNSANISKSVSIYISTSMYNGYYGYYNAALQLPLNGGTRYLPAMHGFFIQCNNPEGGTLTFNNAMRSNETSPESYKSPENSFYRMIKLQAFNTSTPEMTDEAAICFVPKATNGFDNDFDAAKINNSSTDAPDLFSISGNYELAINSLPEFNNGDILIPLGFSAKKPGQYTINVSGLHNIGPDMIINIEDRLSNSKREIENSSSYTFDYKSGESTKGRFYLRLTDNTQPNTSPSQIIPSISIYSSGNEIFCSYFAEEGNSGTAKLYDLQGRIVFMKEMLQPGFNKWTMNTPQGFYILSFTENNISQSFKLYLE